MANTRSIFAATGLVAAAALLTVGTASATATASSVLTYGSAGGTAVAVGDVLGASSSKVSITTTSGGSTGVSCSNSSFSATVTGNPTASGTATESLTALSFSNCTTNIIGATGVKSITANGLPYAATVTSSGAVTIKGPVNTTAVLSTLLGTVTCNYTASSISGTASNSDNSITFTNQRSTLVSGGSLCPSDAYLTVKYAPVQDKSVSGSPAVFVN